MSGRLKTVKSLPFWAPFGLAGGGTSLSPYQAAIISAWRLDEPSGARADSGPYGYSLTDNNTVGSTTGVATNDPAAALFIPANLEYLSRAAGTMAAIESRTENFSIEAAFKINGSIGSFQTIFGKGATANNIAGFWLQLQTSGRAQITLGNGTSRVSVNPTNVLTTATLYHIICTMDRSGNMAMYINNVLGTGTASAAISGITGSLGTSSNLTIGGLVGSTYADMAIGFVRIWNRVLDSTDRSYLYNSGNLRNYNQL